MACCTPPGFYADQRDSRALIRQLAAGRRVLDLCTYTGGFAISAALGEASSVLGGASWHSGGHAGAGMLSMECFLADVPSLQGLSVTRKIMEVVPACLHTFLGSSIGPCPWNRKPCALYSRNAHVGAST